ncbi:MAG: (d)CMP kinase [Bacillota bacterium]|nr:(d)CMP kinase [Bacillota bacterium]
MINIAIDGPSGAGKSTIARRVAKDLGFIYIDTGAMYRTVGLAAVNAGLDPKKDIGEIIKLLDKTDIDISHKGGEQRMLLNGADVSDQIRTPIISIAASDVGVIPEVRQKMLELQRAMADKHNCIMDGRDIGTYVLPNAKIKIFLTADVEDRARRRYEELMSKGEKVSYEDVLADMKYRDNNDSSRECMPLKKADDATLINTTGFELEKSVKLISDFIRKNL